MDCGRWRKAEMLIIDGGLPEMLPAVAVAVAALFSLQTLTEREREREREI